ncbi:hypothetical protein [Actinomadura sp. 9N215]|uniref:hypothetical protein n=1 Tax=Actinomadura sp. 9N215 TaxID=3375150 RepID=UPI00379FB589
MSRVDNQHESEPLVTPQNERVQIDLEMIPLVRALWALGLDTAGCCQNLGESVLWGGESDVKYGGRDRHALFYAGQAWLKMPTVDACGLLTVLARYPEFQDRLNRWTMPGAWECYVYLLADEGKVSPSPLAQVHFPQEQITEVTAVLTHEHEARRG